FALNSNPLNEWKITDKTHQLTFMQKMAGAIQQNSPYDDFLKILCGHDSPICNDTSSKEDIQLVIAYGRSFWTAFSRLLADGQFKSAVFDLPKPRFYSIPKQTALIVDDKKSATIRLGNIEGNPVGCISASLILNKVGEVERRIVAQGITD